MKDLITYCPICERKEGEFRECRIVTDTVYGRSGKMGEERTGISERDMIISFPFCEFCGWCGEGNEVEERKNED